MPKTLNPVDFALGLPAAQMRWAQSMHQVINGGISFGNPTGKDSTGNYSEFSQDNTNGVLIRVGASGSTGTKYKWTTSNTPIAINHGLVDLAGNPRQPIGVHVVNKNKTVDVYMPTTPSTTVAEVAPTDATASVTLYFF